MESLLSQIDVAEAEVEEPQSFEQELRIYPLRHARADELAKLLKDVIVSPSCFKHRSGPSAPRLRIATDQRTNVLVLLAMYEQHVEAAKLIQSLDVPVTAQTTIDTTHREPDSRVEKKAGTPADAPSSR
jgi:type II secretory pathway component GspD/PulD (secretin)